jgi:hypothetical protein
MNMYRQSGWYGNTPYVYLGGTPFGSRPQHAHPTWRFSCYSSSIQENSGITSNRPQPLPYTPFPIHYPPIIPPFTVTARSKAWTVFARSKAGIVGSNPTQRMDVCVCVFSVFALSCVQVVALRRADPSSKEPYRLCKKDCETEEETRAQQRAVDPLMNEMNEYK